MKGLFRSRPRTPVELVHHLRNLLPYAAPNPDVRKTKRREKLEELRKVIHEMRKVLYGDEREPAVEACTKLTLEFFKADTFRLLIASLPHLDAGTRQDVTHVIANLQRQKVSGRNIASEYLERNLNLLDMLMPGCDDSELALCYGSILRDSCIRHQVATKYILETDHIKKFFKHIQDPSFDIASDVSSTFKEILTRHKSTVAEFLNKNHDWFFKEYNSLLESSNYITRRNAVKLLGSMLLDRSNTQVMVRYVGSLANMRIHMNLLRDPSKGIHVDAFHVFKLFPANKKKPPEIVNVLVANKTKLLRFLSDFTCEKADEQFEADKAEVMKEIASLESISQQPR